MKIFIRQRIICLCFIYGFALIFAQKPKAIYLPLNNDTWPQIDSIMFEKSVAALLSATANRVLLFVNATAQRQIFNCTQSSETNRQYAVCILPYLGVLKRNLTAKYNVRRTKRSADDQTPSMLEFFLKWVSKAMRGVKHGYSLRFNQEASSNLTKTNRSDENVVLRSSSYFANLSSIIETALTSDSVEDVLADGRTAYPTWLKEMVKEVHDIVDDMKATENFPNVRLMSPKLFSIQLDSSDTVNIFSPDVLSLHSDGILKIGEKLALLDVIVEASGDSEALRQLLQSKRSANVKETRARPIASGYATLNNRTAEELRQMFHKLDQTYTQEQLDDLRGKGYSFLTAEQLEVVHEKDRYDRFLHTYSQMGEAEKENLLIEAIEQFKFEQGSEGRRRKVKRGAQMSDVILSPLVQSPFMGTPSVLGAFALSPVLFSPIILESLLLEEPDFKPLIFSPVILSPVTLSPVILSPVVFSPFILSPLLLTPVIMSPVVFSPLIMTPAALTPLVFVPGVMSPLIMCPHVLSPMISSPQVLFQEIFSPGYLSPALKSPCKGCVKIGSPCLLC